MKKQAPVKTLWKKAKKDGSDDEVRGLGGAVGAINMLCVSLDSNINVCWDIVYYTFYFITFVKRSIFSHLGHLIVGR
jgi:hypothetical protein